MGHALCDEHPHLREFYDHASQVLGYDLSTLCFEGPTERLNLTEYTQPALLVTSIAVLRLLESVNRDVGAVAGHSLGEYSAIVAAQGLEFVDAVRLVQKRAQYMAEAVPPGSGLVAAVLGMTGEVVQEACREAQSSGVVSAANFNCPGQVVIAGEKAGVERACEILKERGCRRVRILPVSVPVHTSLMQSAADRLASEVEDVAMKDLQVPLINNAEAKPIQKSADVRASLIRQLPAPVLWEQSIKTMADRGITTFVEIGPGTVLTGLVKRIVPEAETLNVQDPSSLEATLARLSA